MDAHWICLHVLTVKIEIEKLKSVKYIHTMKFSH